MIHRHTSLRTALAGLLLLAGTALGEAQEKPMFPFVLPWDDATPGVTSVADWLVKPAGRDGFVTVKGEHLFVGEKRIRFLGTNLCFGANFPKHEDADRIAARMAKFGFNCVRFHHMDHNAAPSGIWSKDMKTLDPGQVDKLDYFIAALKREGIYSNINLHVSREYPDMPKWPKMPGYFKGVDLFYPPMIELQKDYARQLLDRVNPYTKTRYADEPAVAIVEINNENGLIHEWHGGSLDAMTDPYRAELLNRWNAFLEKKYKSDDALRAAWAEGIVKSGDELLANGDLAAGDRGWLLESHKPAAAVGKVDGKSSPRTYEINVSTISPTAWHVQLSHSGLAVEKGRAYVVKMRAKSSAPRNVTLAISQASAPWQGIGSGEVALTTEWQDVSVRIEAGASEANARVQITGLATAVGTISVSDISVRGASVDGLRDGESIALGNVELVTRKRGTPRTPAARRDWMEFLWSVESGYWSEMARFLREDIGIKSPLIGTAVGFSPPTMQSTLDIVDVHGYWQHPSFPKKDWSDTDWFVQNKSLAGQPDGGTLTWMSNRRVAGKPYMCTEFNAAAPNTYSSEALLLSGAYAALQDWDGLFIFAYSHKTNAWDLQKVQGFFDIDQHPTKLVTLPATAALFFRGDVSPAAQRVTVDVTPKDAIAYAMASGSWWSTDNGGVSKLLALQSRLAIYPVDAPTTSVRPPAPDSTQPIVSDTRQLGWDSPRRLVTIDTPRSKALIGKITGEPVRLGEVVIDAQPNQQNWAAITLTVMQGESFTSAGTRILLTATGNIENTGQQWKNEEKTTVGRDWGKAPSLVEGVPAKVTLPVSAARLKAYVLDEKGQRREPLTIEPAGEHAVLSIGPDQKTLWYEIVVE